MKPPQLNSKWKHKNNQNVYQVLLITNLYSDRFDEYPITVVYQCLKSKKIWSRTLDRWYGSFSRYEMFAL